MYAGQANIRLQRNALLQSSSALRAAYRRLVGRCFIIRLRLNRGWLVSLLLLMITGLLLVSSLLIIAGLLDLQFWVSFNAVLCKSAAKEAYVYCSWGASTVCAIVNIVLRSKAVRRADPALLLSISLYVRISINV